MNRQEKIQALLPTVRPEGDGSFSVESLSTPGWRYIITPKTNEKPASCECEDYRRQSARSTGYRCIHLLAVRAHLRALKEATKEEPPKVPTIKASQLSMEERIKQRMAAQAKALSVLDPYDRYQGARECIEAGYDDEFTREEAFSAWLEYIDSLPEEDGLAFTEAN